MRELAVLHDFRARRDPGDLPRATVDGVHRLIAMHLVTEASHGPFAGEHGTRARRHRRRSRGVADIEAGSALPSSATGAEGANGTCSILDIRGIAHERAPGVAAPLPGKTLVAIFGTTKPKTSDRTGERESSSYNLLGRGESHFVVYYDENGPSEVTFYGFSWD